MEQNIFEEFNTTPIGNNNTSGNLTIDKLIKTIKTWDDIKDNKDSKDIWNPNNNKYILTDDKLISFPIIPAPSLLPIAIKVEAHTIGLDLVAVQPMSAPIGQLAYMDFDYDSDEDIRKKELAKKIEARKNKIDILLGEKIENYKVVENTMNTIKKYIKKRGLD